VTLPSSVPSGSPLWPVGPAKGAWILNGPEIASVTFRSDTGFPPINLILQIIATDAIPDGDGELYVPPWWRGVRGPRGEWLAPGFYPYTA
jgi:hypothetical protein